MKKTFARWIATAFGLGLAPKAPGTAGSIGGIAAAWALNHVFGWRGPAFAILAAILTPAAIWASGVVAQSTGRKDPQIVVIDEVAGQWVALAGALALNWKSWLAAFLLFRLFDIWKPPPVRQLERIPGGTGIVVDDLAAGVYAALVLAAAGWFNLY